MREESDRPDATLAQIATRQHGVITVVQLREVGLDKSAVSRRANARRLHRLHRGVYAVGHRAPSWHARWMAAVLACGDGAVLSHHSAAALWNLLRPIDGAVHVSVPTTSGLKKRPGIHLHRCLSLSPSREPSSSPSYPQPGGRGGRLTTHRHRIPVTTIQRTIDDLRASSLLPPHLVRRAIRQAEHKGHRLEGIESYRTRSDLETLFLAVIHSHLDRLPPPEVNVKLGRWEVDFLWRAQRLVVEVDSFTYHRGSVAFYADHARDLDLRAAGYTVLRFDDVQLEDEPARVAADVAAELALSGAARG